MDSQILRQEFLDFFKKRGHKIIPSSSLIPADSTVLFTTAGMQQFSLHLAGKKDPLQDFGTRHVASCQKCFRTNDIEEVGDDTHHTFFEMLGNWSIGRDENGDYFKEGAIKHALEFFVDTLHLNKDKFYITIFKGENNIPKDDESFKIWQKNGIPKERIKEFGKDNFWGPVGETGPCGPCSEIHYDRGEKFGCGKSDCGPNCENCKRFVELWNLVFMEYWRDEAGNYQKLPQQNVDTGIGFERLLTILQQKPSAYETDLFLPVIQEIEKLSPGAYNFNTKACRIIADHLRGASFLISEGILPSNLDRGYILRRLIRRTVRYARILNLKNNWYQAPIKKIIEIYSSVYSELQKNEEKILTVWQNEEEKFSRALNKGLKEFEKLIKELENKKQNIISGEDAFDLYQSYGFPIELIEELAKEKNFQIDKIGFETTFKHHQEISRAGAEKKFGGHGIKTLKTVENLKIAKLHTATHLLHSALRKVLGSEVKQMGSDITEERLRFDFSFPRKLTKEELQEVENLVNQKIQENLKVKKEEMSLNEALASGALAFFREKYPKKVSVYTIFNSSTGEVFSKEICAGPHVEETGELGEFKIQKEESSSAGIRRIKATIKT